MGLDMYARRVKTENGIDALSISADADTEEFFYWRKHHNLHGWMTNRYLDKGGTKEFNCQNLELTAYDLDDLAMDIIENKLPDTTGFFFGNNPPDADSNSEDLEFISKARKVIAEGDLVYYSAWY